MANANMDGLPPEMQARIQQIIEGAKQNAQAPAPAQQAQPAPAVAQAPAPPVRQPNLMDHVIMLRKEVDAMRQQIAAMGQVTEACGNAVGQMYSMFQSQTEPTNNGGYYQEEESPVGPGDF